MKLSSVCLPLACFINRNFKKIVKQDFSQISADDLLNKSSFKQYGGTKPTFKLGRANYSTKSLKFIVSRSKPYYVLTLISINMEENICHVVDFGFDFSPQHLACKNTALRRA